MSAEEDKKLFRRVSTSVAQTNQGIAYVVVFCAAAKSLLRLAAEYNLGALLVFDLPFPDKPIPESHAGLKGAGKGPRHATNRNGRITFNRNNKSACGHEFVWGLAVCTNFRSSSAMTASLRYMKRPARWIPATRAVASENTGEPELPCVVEQS